MTKNTAYKNTYTSEAVMIEDNDKKMKLSGIVCLENKLNLQVDMLDVAEKKLIVLEYILSREELISEVYSEVLHNLAEIAERLAKYDYIAHVSSKKIIDKNTGELSQDFKQHNTGFIYSYFSNIDNHYMKIDKLTLDQLIEISILIDNAFGYEKEMSKQFEGQEKYNFIATLYSKAKLTKCDRNIPHEIQKSYKEFIKIRKQIKEKAAINGSNVDLRTFEQCVRHKIYHLLTSQFHIETRYIYTEDKHLSLDIIKSLFEYFRAHIESYKQNLRWKSGDGYKNSDVKVKELSFKNTIPLHFEINYHLDNGSIITSKYNWYKNKTWTLQVDGEAFFDELSLFQQIQETKYPAAEGV